MKPPRWMAIGGIAVAALLGLTALKNVVAKAALIGGVKAAAGLDVAVRQVDVGLWNTAIGIRGLQLANPSGFPDRVMVDLPELYVNYRLLPFLRGRVHLEEVRLQLRELVVEKNAQGQLNLTAIPAVRQAQAHPAGASAPPAKAPPLQIDLLRLQIGTVTYKDYTAGPAPRVQTFRVNLDERYEHITHPEALASLIIVKALATTSIAQLAHFDVGALRGQAQEALRGAVGLAAQTLGSAAGLGHEAGEEAARTADKTLKAFKKLLPTHQ